MECNVTECNVTECNIKLCTSGQSLYYLLTPRWAANWFAASQEIPRISRNPKVHYRTHKRPPPINFITQRNYKATCFDYRLAILRTILSIVSQDAVHTVGSHRVYIREYIKLNRLSLREWHAGIPKCVVTQSTK